MGPGTDGMSDNIFDKIDSYWKESRYLMKYLILPLFISFWVVLLISYPWEGFWVNLSTTLLGILITVTLIDYILRKHEARRWYGTRNKIYNRVMRFANNTTRHIRITFGFGMNIFNTNITPTSDTARLETIRITKTHLIPNIETRIWRMDQQEWINFISGLESIKKENERFFELFGSALEPEIFSLLLSIGEQIEGLLLNYELIPEVFIGPNDPIPPGMPPEYQTHKIHYYRVTSQLLNNILKDIIRLLEELPKNTHD